MTLRWAVRLGSYDDDAPGTLLAQLDMLHLLLELKDPSLELTFRITAEPGRNHDTMTRCHLVCASNGTSSRSHEALLDMASVGLIRGYHLTNVGKEVSERPRNGLLELMPIVPPGRGLPIKPDWSPIFDLFRRRGRGATVEISCRYAPEPHDGLRPPMSTISGNDPATGLFAALENALAPRIGSICLSVVMWGRESQDDAIMRTIGRMILGTECIPHPLRNGAKAQGIQCSSIEALRTWHAPYGEIQGRGLGRGPTRVPMSAGPTAKQGVSLGLATRTGPRYDVTTDVVSGWKDRTHHVYIVGKTGSGKTNLLKRIARQDIQAGKGCLVVSPHADLIEYIIDTLPEGRLNDVVLLDFSDARFTPVVNPLTMDVNSPEARAAAIEQVTSIITEMSYHEFAGPVFHDTVRTALHTVCIPRIHGAMDPTISVGMEMVRDQELRNWAARIVRSDRRDIANEWSNITNLKASDVAEFVRWVTAKFSDFASGGALRAATSSGATRSPLSIRSIYREGKILLVNLPETYLGGGSADFLGRLLFERIYDEARITAPSRRRPFLVHIDEFQRFVGGNLEVLVTEARKFQLGMAFAHQNLRQLQQFSRFEGSSSPRLAEAIFANVGTLITMRTSGNDVAELARELQVPEQRIRGIAPFEALARCTLDQVEMPAFTLRVPLENAPIDRLRRRVLRQRMIDEGYWQPKAGVNRAVDMELARLRALADPSRAIRKQTAKGEESTSPGSSFLDDWLSKRRVDRDTASNADPAPVTD